MLGLKDFYNYQHHAYEHAIDNPYCGLFLEMGLGKTIVALTAINELMYNRLEINKTLIIAPKKVAESVWKQESAAWAHTRHLKISLMIGSEMERLIAMKTKADVYVIGVDNFAWLLTKLGNDWRYDMVVIDELSCFKSPDSKRFKAAKIIRPYLKRVIALTGTPAGNGLIDLWAEMFLIDLGKRLGQTITNYRLKYFTPAAHSGHHVYSYALKEKGIEKIIYSKIKDICISMKQSDYQQLPKLIEKVMDIQIPKKVRLMYDEFEKTQVLKMIDEEITAVNAQSLNTKLLQFCNGAVYDEEHNYHIVHDEKLEAFKELVDTAQGQNIIVFYQFKSDKDRILKLIKGSRFLKTQKDIDDWNAGKIKVLVTHARSAGHGLNLQFGGNIVVWYGCTWSLEQFQQANKRLHRKGQIKPVYVYILVIADTWDIKPVKSVRRKGVTQDDLMTGVKALVNKYKYAA